MLKYWEALREAVRPEIFSPLRRQGLLRELWKNHLQEGTVPVEEQPAASTLKSPGGPAVDFSWHYLPPPFSLGQIFRKLIF